MKVTAAMIQMMNLILDQMNMVTVAMTAVINIILNVMTKGVGNNQTHMMKSAMGTHTPWK
jgi:hypothetical protein